MSRAPSTRSAGLARAGAALLLLCASAACSGEPRTCELETRDLIMWVTLTDVDGEVELELEFEAAGTDNAGATLELCPGRDELTVNGVAPQQVRAFGHTSYEFSFAEGQVSSSYIIDLVRGKQEDLSVELESPPPFELLAPEGGSAHSRGASLELSWEPAWVGEMMSVGLVDGIGSSCIEGLGYSALVDDMGSHVIKANELVGGPGNPECEVSLVLVRSLELDYPEELHPGGAFTAYVSRSLELRSTP